MKGKKGPRPPNKETKPNGHAKEMVLQCDNCKFNSVHPPEMTEHLAGTGHTGYKEIPKPEPELFAEPKPVKRSLRVKLSPEEIAKHEHTITAIAIQRLEQEEIAALAKERVKSLETDERAAIAKIRDPFKNAEVLCEWRVNFEENSKSLYRTDTNEVVETKPLSAEDRAAELKRTAKENQAAEAAQAVAS